MARRTLSPPFSPTTSPVRTGNPTQPNLPAAYSDDQDKLVRLSNSHSAFVRLDLDVSRLNEVHQYLWLAGRSTCARALHRQKMIERQIIIVEQADLHLVWQEARIFLKPLPDYLLDHQFWEDTICYDAELHANACGFLLSYVWLVRHPSDLRIASELGLLSSQMQWEDWVVFADTLLTNIDHDALDTINKRYQYGELRLSRLNLIRPLFHLYRSGKFVRGYMTNYNRYTVFFSRIFGWVLLVFIYMNILLTALQVGLGTDELQHDKRFQRAAYGFAVFSLVSPVVILGAAALVFLYLFAFNLITTRTFLNRTKRHREELVESKAGAAP
ncbi:hypothetical protein BU16DRAFT_522852 [Lophium mytilinum]|uniref:Uncharacterized protein n=1 Tax=Lophium mytilinum TaxID=390894 RepID=A0A6A6R6L4_9PEZI|nr:hypothetical protein BU16DRAFT_522852 [Lophium mytilinum]